MTVPERRAAVNELVSRGLSVHRACQLVPLGRTTFRYQPQVVQEDGLAAQLQALAQEQPRSGYRRAWAVVHRTRRVNRTRVQRLWTQAQLQVKRGIRPRTRQKRSLPLQAAWPNHIWTCDFVQDCDQHGNTLYILPVMDAFTREGLAIDVEMTTAAERGMGVMAPLVARHGTPTYVRSDNGAECGALSHQLWLAKQHIQPLSSDPGWPWQNGKDERFNGTVRDEWLNMRLFGSVMEARLRLEAFRQHSNGERPHSQLGDHTPLAFKQAWKAAQKKQQDSLILT